MGKLPFAVSLLTILGLAAPALAQQGMFPGAMTWRYVRFADRTEVRVDNTWAAQAGGADRTGRVTVGTTSQTRPIQVHEGPAVVTAVATRGNTVLVAMVHAGARSFARLVLADIGPDGRLAAREAIDAPRRNDGDFAPASVVACPDPEGFTVLWQEPSARDPRSDVRTYMARIASDGSWLQRPAVVEVPWALAAIAHNGHGYHLALYFDTEAGVTRVCLVTLTAAGVPEQHPWWASAAGPTDEVQLAVRGDRVLAFYRGGPGGDRLLSADVTAVGQWGAEPGAARAQGEIRRDQEFALRQVGGGEPEIVRRSIAELR